MVEIIKASEVPTAEITCNNCKSVLRYGNRDLDKNIRESRGNYSFLGYAEYYTFRCPVCGVKVEALWIEPKE